MTGIEICLEDIDAIAPVAQAGAQRIELCANLAEGGTTPSIGTVSEALKVASGMGVRVLIRQRPGDFCYDRGETAAMIHDITAMRALPNPHGVDLGFVFGALTIDNTADTGTLGAVMDAAGDHPVTFHKAFDQVPDLTAALDLLIEAGVDRVLTSGGAVTAAAGAGTLTELVESASSRIGILAGGGIRPGNAADLIRRTGVPEIHLRAPDPAVVDRRRTSAAVVQEVVKEVAASTP